MTYSPRSNARLSVRRGLMPTPGLLGCGTLCRRHFDAEEAILFPAFEAHTGMSMGPTRVMRNEHDQMRELLDAAKKALDERDAEDYSGSRRDAVDHDAAAQYEGREHPLPDVRPAVGGGQQQALLAQLLGGICGALK